MKKIAALMVLMVFVALLVAPGVAHAATTPASGQVVTGFPVTFSTNEVDPMGGSVKFLVDGVEVGRSYVKTIWKWSEEDGDYIIEGYVSTIKATVPDGNHTYKIVQASKTRYEGTFAVDAEPVVSDVHWGDGGIHLIVKNNEPAVTTNAYKYDKSGSGAAMTTLSSSTVAGVTTIERLRPHAMCCDIGDGWCCDIHGISVKVTDGTSPVTGRMVIDWKAFSVDEPLCDHYNGGVMDDEAIYYHDLECLNLY